ncbi:unnamed protein product [Staurois parvus]|uniref:Uncharacterized protein n=1 Tax=Staurois parvus TaxID=386267 RepID=A0ABN9DAH7_9NEOB|nr:unnamed protein product [Staurois parvus]
MSCFYFFESPAGSAPPAYQRLQGTEPGRRILASAGGHSGRTLRDRRTR